ncbi:peptide chain release factor 2 [Candidatus Aerophobetes bacterium]|uniref:Peptide chain release factor 2 n=1 Tax=Aerophobetes bacterium TaxID=2030807 RepID=A0A2A4X0H9_UNCAE|nr:MAG: peptide chain release factor 2 [Candidatus Aerophobetes bacterium]
MSICGGIFDLAAKSEKIKELEIEMGSSHFWDDATAAKVVIKESNLLKVWLDPYKDMSQKLTDVKSLLVDLSEQDDPEFYQDLVTEITNIETALEALEVRKMLSGELDAHACFLSINAGAGGTESCDWAQMLLRMYEKWAIKKGFTTDVIDKVAGEVVGIKSVTVRFTGPFAYGLAKAERGVHRLVRISPFDSNSKRHTSFASVDVIAEIDDDIEVTVRPDEIRVDTYRASGAGGQHVNTTDSAVRITHLKTGIVATCQAERSQIQNRETCMKMLKSKLYERELEEQKKKQSSFDTEKKEIAFGSQIRSYVFHPYQLVKDTRTKLEEGNIGSVMDGNIDAFIDAYLKEGFE